MNYFSDGYIYYLLKNFLRFLYNDQEMEILRMYYSETLKESMITFITFDSAIQIIEEFARNANKDKNDRYLQETLKVQLQIQYFDSNTIGKVRCKDEIFKSVDEILNKYKKEANKDSYRLWKFEAGVIAST